jgi:hypothetical protein
MADEEQAETTASNRDGAGERTPERTIAGYLESLAIAANRV